MKRLFASLAILAGLTLTTGICSCSDSDEKTELPNSSSFLEVTQKTVNFKEGASEETITIKSNGEWEAIVDNSGSGWCKAQKDNGKVIISVGENPEKAVRKTIVQIKSSSKSVDIEVAQLGWGKAILLEKSQFDVPTVGGEIELKITTNIEYIIEKAENTGWIEPAVQSRAEDKHPVVTTGRKYNVKPNPEEGARSTTLTIKDKDPGSDLEKVECTVTQNGTKEYKPLDPESIKEDIKVKVTGGNASKAQNGQGIEHSYDGKLDGEIYHSPWDNKATDYFPITLEYNFAAGSDMDYFIYYPRRDSRNGRFKKVKIEAKSNANTRGTDEWKEVFKEYDFAGSASPTRVDFPQSLIGVSAIRFTVLSGDGDGQGFASCAEMEFYKKNPQAFDFSTLFTDATCSELKPGIGEAEIEKCQYSFFKNIAYFMLKNKYSKEFRINTFKAYPHPDVQGKSNKTNPYSLLDNPTGISVKKDETLIILSNELPKTKVTLRVQNLDAPDADGANNPVDYPLASGTNKIKMKEKGLVYVMYHTPDYENAQPVKLHFASGTVNGYFDSQNETHKGREQQLLNAATDKYFDVLGKYAHLTFPTSRFKNHTKDLRKLIETFDTIVYNEQELLGLVKYNKMFKNRMYFGVMYTSYMYATAYRTAYNDGTLGDLCDETKLSTSSCWGPAHEVGHCNQTRPGVKWHGTTEVTNNIMSEYIQTTVFKQNSRVQTEDMNDRVSKNRYSKAWNNIIVNKLSHAKDDDVFCKLIPFWQLELYFGKVLGKTPKMQTDKGGFYPDVYEYVRTNEDKKTAGEQQLEFVYICSKIANINLLDFFEKWGFLREVNYELDDYGKAFITVTAAQAENIRKRVEALNLPKLDNVPLEYITDNNVKVFKDKQPVQAGTAQRSGNTITMSNWKNVVVYEVRENNDKGTLICVSDGILTPSETASFDVKDGWKDSYKVYAVSHDNKRTEVKFQ